MDIMSPEPTEEPGLTDSDGDGHSNVNHLVVSSEDETDVTDAHAGYSLLPQEPELELSHNDDIDYESLDEIMAAFNANGPAVITDNADLDNSVDILDKFPNSAFPDQIPIRQIEPHLNQTLSRLHSDAGCEQASIWQSPRTNVFPLNSGQEEEIKRVMSQVTLPPSAIPPWAMTISEEEWKERLLNSIQKRQESPL